MKIQASYLAGFTTNLCPEMVQTGEFEVDKPHLRGY